MSDHNLYFFHLKWSTGKMGVDIKIDKKKTTNQSKITKKGIKLIFFWMCLGHHKQELFGSVHFILEPQI